MLLCTRRWPAGDVFALAISPPVGMPVRYDVRLRIPTLSFKENKKVIRLEVCGNQTYITRLLVFIPAAAIAPIQATPPRRTIHDGRSK